MQADTILSVTTDGERRAVSASVFLADNSHDEYVTERVRELLDGERSTCAFGGGSSPFVVVDLAPMCDEQKAANVCEAFERFRSHMDTHYLAPLTNADTAPARQALKDLSLAVLRLQGRAS